MEREICPQHGGPRSECEQPRPWYPQRSVCYARQAHAAAQRRFDEIHEDTPWHDGTYTVFTAKPTTATPFHYMDGVTLWVSSKDLSPDDDFLGDLVTSRPPSSGPSVPVGLDGERRPGAHEADSSHEESQHGADWHEFARVGQ